MPDRPPFILCFAADTQGSGFHRIMTPLASLVQAGVANGRIDAALWQDEMAEACQPDVIVFQRQVEDGQIELMRRWRQKLPDTLFVYELDDYLDEIPPASFHASFMPPDIRGRITRAISICDRVTTTTEPMAVWLRSLSGVPVMVVPNALPAGRLKERKARTSGKLRVGFAGGMSHSGDLELLRDAMTTIGDAVQWVFFGTQLDAAPINVEFHQGLPPTMYLDKLASLDMDLMLAPLEANRFNECKSNLRLLETAVAGACVIAQDFTPYRTNQPPVYAYATTPTDWADCIKHFMQATIRERQTNAEQLRAWVGRHYTLERVTPDRMNAWLPTCQGKHWTPDGSPDAAVNRFVIASTDSAAPRIRLPFLARVRCISTGLEAACREALTLKADLLWLRPGASLTKRGLEALKSIAGQSRQCASVLPLASDGPNSFPQLDRWVPLPLQIVEVIDNIVDTYCNDVTLPVQSASGPAIYLTASALKALGLPDVAGADGNEEQAIMEWGLMANSRGWKHIQAVGAYAGSTEGPVQAAPRVVARLTARGYGEILKTAPERILTQETRSKIEVELLRRRWSGPRPGAMGFDSSYESWLLLRSLQDGGVSFQNAPDLCVEREMGRDLVVNDDAWVIFTDDSVSLHPDALTWLNRAAYGVSEQVMVIYADHESVVGNARMPEFKPDLDQALLMAQDYVTPICAIRGSCLESTPANRFSLFGAILRILREFGGGAFHHVQRILGSVRVESQPELLALETLERKLWIERIFGNEIKVSAHNQLLGCLIANWKTEIDHLVSIVIPTLGSGRLLEPCVKTILQHTNYPNYEIVIVLNGERAEPELAADILERPNISVVKWPNTFNWAAVNNWAIRYHTKGQFIVTMNDDVCVASKDWLSAMLAHAVMPDVGAVGAKLVHPAGVIQHVGVVCHEGVAGHMHKGMANGSPGYMGRALLTHEAVAVTGACMLFSRRNFNLVAGFNETFAMNYNDTVFCLELHKLGLRNVVEMSAELLHPEASTRSPSNTPEGFAVLLADNLRLAERYPDRDPYWNSNLQIVTGQGGLVLQGLNADILAWTDTIPAPDVVRILLINDHSGAAGMAINIARAGMVPFAADLSGFKLRLTAPVPMNLQPWDIRQGKVLAQGLRALGITHIILRSMVGLDGAAPPIETLRVLSSLRPEIGLSIEAIDLATMAPWLLEDDAAADDDTFGYVDMATWKAVYDNVMLG